MDKKVGVVICNFNKKESVLECIQCILESKFTDFDLYVVDNASTDGAQQAIKDKYGNRLTLIVNDKNLGGSGGFNTGLRAAYAKGYPYLMCVDNDAMLDENAIGNLYSFLEEHSEVGMAASKIYHAEAPDYVQQFGQKIDFDYFCTEVPHLDMYEDGSMPDYLYVDCVAACSLMVRRDTIEKIGFMPEDNFLYWDDTEWCYLCNKAGMKVASVGASKALHAMGAKKETVNTFPTYYAWRNWIAFFSRYTSEDKLEKMAETFLNTIFKIVYEGIHNGESNRVKTVMLAYDDAIHGIRGRAGKNRIFEIDFNMQPFVDLIKSAKSFYIETGNYPVLANHIKDMSKQLNINACFVDNPEGAECVISLCESIFDIDDFSMKKVYMDISDCILRTEDDVMNVINFNYSRRAFVFANKSVFLEKIRLLRSGECLA